VTIMAGEAIGGSELGGAAGAAGMTAPILGANQKDPSPGGSSVAFAIAILLIGFACIGLWIAFHKPENAETGGFPGLFGQMLQWVHAGEQSPGAAAEASATPSPSEIQQLKSLPASFWAKLQTVSGGGLKQFAEWVLHLPGI
jgi:hypothetical protein